LEVRVNGITLIRMTLDRMRRIQKLRLGRIFAAAMILAFLTTGGLSLSCLIAAGQASVSAASHCNDCPDHPSPDTCSSAALCIFAGTAAIRPEQSAVARIVTAPDRIDSKPVALVSIRIAPPNPPPIRA
jgi:hypothetical protein